MVHLLDDVEIDLGGRRVLLVDDIVDTGRSIAYAARLLQRRWIGDLWTCALIDKPEPRQVEVTVDFVGFSNWQCGSARCCRFGSAWPAPPRDGCSKSASAPD